MQLDAYLKDQNLTPSRFAALLGKPPSTITRVLKGERKPTIELLLAIEAATGGAVTKEELRPDIWPESVERAS